MISFTAIKKQLQQNKKIILVISLALSTVLIFGGYTLYQKIQNNGTLQQPLEEVKGSLITLKLMTDEHIVDLHNAFTSIVRKGIEFPPHITLGYSVHYLRSLMKNHRDGKTLLYTIFDNKDQKPIGLIEIREYDPTDVGQMGCWLNDNYWGGGRIQEAVKLISRTYFRLHPERSHYVCWVRMWNQRSYKAMKKAGFVEIGAKYHDGKPAHYILEMKNPF
jgi:RimJ/RimL family protein N-acetyltransferase